MTEELNDVFLRSLAHVFVTRGKPQSEANRLAVSTAEQWAAGERNVSEATRARSRLALEDLEVMANGLPAGSSYGVRSDRQTVEFETPGGRYQAVHDDDGWFCECGEPSCLHAQIASNVTGIAT